MLIQFRGQLLNNFLFFSPFVKIPRTVDYGGEKSCDEEVEPYPS
jgi:hypothetical protein